MLCACRSILTPLVKFLPPLPTVEPFAKKDFVSEKKLAWKVKVFRTVISGNFIYQIMKGTVPL